MAIYGCIWIEFGISKNLKRTCVKFQNDVDLFIQFRFFFFLSFICFDFVIFLNDLASNRGRNFKKDEKMTRECLMKQSFLKKESSRLIKLWC